MNVLMGAKPRFRLPAFAALVAAAMLACVATPALSASRGAPTLRVEKAIAQPGVQHMHFSFGPVHIKPGQNDIKIAPNDQRPTVPGYIVSFAPNLRRPDGSVPRVDVIHLHHGVWLINGKPTFAAGEEKTIMNLPAGFGFSYQPSDQWLMNYMIHNLTPNPDTVYITYDIGFIPATSPAAKRMHPVRTQWMDVRDNGNPFVAYPVFDVHKGSGRNGSFTYPTQATNPYGGGPALNQWTVDTPSTLVWTAGHLHPGGLHDDLWVTRKGRTVHLFQSLAHYYEPAGAVSWDVAMTATPQNWRVAVKPGDVVSVTGTYATNKASWYESMAIMPVAVAYGVPGLDPFKKKVDRPGPLTHGHLPENDNHGGGAAVLPDPSKVLDGPVASGPVDITNFEYTQGDLTAAGSAGLPPVIHRGQALTFANSDTSLDIFHTITACRTPCNRTTGVAYPLANGSVEFDSGELGTGPVGFTPASNRTSWSTPSNLAPGTYAYFCRIHPFMRGSFRVVA